MMEKLSDIFTFGCYENNAGEKGRKSGSARAPMKEVKRERVGRGWSIGGWKEGLIRALNGESLR